MVRYVGIDVDKMRCHVAMMDQEGVMIDEFTFTNNPEGIQGLASKLNVEDRAVMESTGSVWLSICRIFCLCASSGSNRMSQA